jgi:capsular polysaccharide biosynthesis protein
MLSSAKKGRGTQILDRAIPPLSSTGPPREKFLALGWGVAIAAGLAVAFLLELLDHRLRDPDRIAKVLGMPTLCVLPMIRTKEQS